MGQEHKKELMPEYPTFSAPCNRVTFLSARTATWNWGITQRGQKTKKLKWSYLAGTHRWEEDLQSTDHISSWNAPSVAKGSVFLFLEGALKTSLASLCREQAQEINFWRGQSVQTGASETLRAESSAVSKLVGLSRGWDVQHAALTAHLMCPSRKNSNYLSGRATIPHSEMY